VVQNKSARAITSIFPPPPISSDLIPENTYHGRGMALVDDIGRWRTEKNNAASLAEVQEWFKTYYGLRMPRW